MEITKEIKEALKAPFGPEMISPNPKKPFLSTIKAYAIIERLNEVFGIGTWQLKSGYIQTFQKQETTKEGKVRYLYEVMAKATLDIPTYNIHLEQFGGGEDEVLGDAAKGAVTDALNKCASYLYIGYDVFMGNVPAQQQTNKSPYLDFNMITNAQTIDELNNIYNKYVVNMEDGTKMKTAAKNLLTKRKNELKGKEAA